MRELTVVVGAGANVELGMPTGDGLKKLIASALDLYFDFGRQTKGSHRVAEGIRHAAANNQARLNALSNAAWRIRDAMVQAPSIDTFVDMTNDETVTLAAKLAIAECILDAERSSKLAPRSERGTIELDHRKVSGSWLGPLFHLIVDGCRPDQLAVRFREICLVIFNYDRCFEHFMVLNLQKYFEMSERTAVDLISELEIFHPYGTVGCLPWQEPSEAVEYGLAPSGERLLRVAGGIKTFTEGTDPNASDIIAIRSAIGEAKRLLFLGFAYHPLNLELLQQKREHGVERADLKRIFGTGVGISQPDLDDIRQELTRLGDASPNAIHLLPGKKCPELIAEFSRGLMLPRPARR